MCGIQMKPSNHISVSLNFYLQKSYNEPEKWQGRKRIRVHFARRKKNDHCTLTCANVRKRKILAKFAKRMTMRKRNNRNVARIHIKHRLANKISHEQKTTTTKMRCIHFKLFDFQIIFFNNKLRKIRF